MQMDDGAKGLANVKKFCIRLVVEMSFSDARPRGRSPSDLACSSFPFRISLNA